MRGASVYQWRVWWVVWGRVGKRTPMKTPATETTSETSLVYIDLDDYDDDDRLSADAAVSHLTYRHNKTQIQYCTVVSACWWATGHHIIYHIIHIVVLKPQNRLKVGTDKHKQKVKMQSVSDDDVVKRLPEKTRFELAAKGVSRLGRCYVFWQGVPGPWASNWESMAADGWLLDRWHQKTIGACRTKRPSARKTAYWHEWSSYGGALPWRTLNVRWQWSLQCTTLYNIRCQHCWLSTHKATL